MAQFPPGFFFSNCSPKKKAYCRQRAAKVFWSGERLAHGLSGRLAPPGPGRGVGLHLASRTFARSPQMVVTSECIQLAGGYLAPVAIELFTPKGSLETRVSGVGCEPRLLEIV